jgi:hypothetical protein
MIGRCTSRAGTRLNIPDLVLDRRNGCHDIHVGHEELQVL